MLVGRPFPLDAAHPKQRESCRAIFARRFSAQKSMLPIGRWDDSTKYIRWDSASMYPPKTLWENGATCRDGTSATREGTDYRNTRTEDYFVLVRTKTSRRLEGRHGDTARRRHGDRGEREGEGGGVAYALLRTTYDVRGHHPFGYGLSCKAKENGAGLAWRDGGLFFSFLCPILALLVSNWPRLGLLLGCSDRFQGEERVRREKSQ